MSSVPDPLRRGPLKPSARLHAGDVVTVSREIPTNTMDAVLCDPPYHLTENSRGGSPRVGGRGTPFGRHGVGTDRGFMGQTWDGGDVAFLPDTWRAVAHTMKPGAYLLAFGGSRTLHRLAVAIEDAGLILVDTLMWLYGSGFPKSHNVSKSIDRSSGIQRKIVGVRKHPTLKDPMKVKEPAGAAHGSNSWGREWNITSPGCDESRSWDGYGTALKPAFEPILLCRKPGEKTYAENVRRWGCGALNIDRCRIPASQGRFPANLLLDEEAAAALDAQTGILKSGTMAAGTPRTVGNKVTYHDIKAPATRSPIHANEGGASRSFTPAR